MFSDRTKVYGGSVNLSETNTTWTKIVNLVEPGRRVLEVGCAAGGVSEFLAKDKGCRVTGIEISVEAARRASSYCDTVVIGDVENGALDRVQGTFHAIIFADVLEHLRNPHLVLHESRRFLEGGGYVLLSLPNVAHWDVRRMLLGGSFEYARGGLLDETHLRFFTYESALKLIESGGFCVEEFDLVFKLPRLWKYPGICSRWERQLHRLVLKHFRGIFGYQFVFKIRPTGLSATKQS